MAKAKKEKLILANLDEANAVLGRLRADRRQFAEVKLAVEKRIKAIEDANEAELKRLAASCDACERTLKDSAMAHPEWFKDTRSVALPNGKIGWLKVWSIKFERTVEFVMARLRSIDRADAIIVKESVNKEVLSAMDDGDLASVGARKVARDEFQIEV